MNKKIIKLENNKEYFVISELIENNDNYLLVINVDNESEVKIIKKVSENSENFIIEEVQSDILPSLKNKFKELVDNDKKLYI